VLKTGEGSTGPIVLVSDSARIAEGLNPLSSLGRPQTVVNFKFQPLGGVATPPTHCGSNIILLLP